MGLTVFPVALVSPARKSTPMQKREREKPQWMRWKTCKGLNCPLYNVHRHTVMKYIVTVT